MSWTKRQIITQAFSELGYSSYAYSLPDDQLYVSKHRLDSMMATWNGRGITLGYPLVSSHPEADLNTDTELPDWALEAVYTNLAIRIAGSIGKQAPTELRKTAREAYKAVLMRQQITVEMQFPKTLPRGSGNRSWTYGSVYFPVPEENLEVFDGDGILELE